MMKGEVAVKEWNKKIFRKFIENNKTICSGYLFIYHGKGGPDESTNDHSVFKPVSGFAWVS